IVYIFHGIKYWFQGYTTPNGFHMEIFQYQPPAEGYTWEFDASSADEGKKAFITAPIFEGKTFWEVEQEIEWTDE
ncbi:MAG: hypothetical protein LUH40_06675, partial [Clostridiales bacterium]|nr:hypothetical protein [Clostridiales bacterium]